ncbi:MAG: hypothetical protein KDD78_16740 [Caldilineaceae bacterium]|nr:hypothetical protein [Caldilineaceae bacterium]
MGPRPQLLNCKPSNHPRGLAFIALLLMGLLAACRPTPPAPSDTVMQSSQPHAATTHPAPTEEQAATAGATMPDAETPAPKPSATEIPVTETSASTGVDAAAAILVPTPTPHLILGQAGPLELPLPDGWQPLSGATLDLGILANGSDLGNGLVLFAAQPAQADSASTSTGLPLLTGLRVPRDQFTLEGYLFDVIGQLTAAQVEVQRAAILFDQRADGRPVAVIDYLHENNNQGIPVDIGMPVVTGRQSVLISTDGAEFLIVTMLAASPDELAPYLPIVEQIVLQLDTSESDTSNTDMSNTDMSNTENSQE